MHFYQVSQKAWNRYRDKWWKRLRTVTACTDMSMFPGHNGLAHWSLHQNSGRGTIQGVSLLFILSGIQDFPFEISWESSALFLKYSRCPLYFDYSLLLRFMHLSLTLGVCTNREIGRKLLVIKNTDWKVNRPEMISPYQANRYILCWGRMLTGYCPFFPEK